MRLLLALLVVAVLVVVVPMIRAARHRAREESRRALEHRTDGGDGSVVNAPRKAGSGRDTDKVEDQASGDGADGGDGGGDG